MHGEQTKPFPALEEHSGADLGVETNTRLQREPHLIFEA